jgi:hypothetical protein
MCCKCLCLVVLAVAAAGQFADPGATATAPPRAFRWKRLNFTGYRHVFYGLN